MADLVFCDPSIFNIAPVYQHDSVENTKKLSAVLEWKPFLKISDTNISRYNTVFGLDNVRVFLQPAVAIEPRWVLDQPTDTELEDGAYLRYGLSAGLKLYDYYELTYRLEQREDIGEFDEGRYYTEAMAKLFFDRNEQYSLTFTFKKGEEAPDFKKVESYNVGFGIKF